MKTNMMKITAFASLFAAVAFVGCSSDDSGIVIPPDGGGGETPDVETELQGTISQDSILDPAIAYELKGTLLVEAGATLTIPAGTTITSDAGTENYIAVLKGAQIDVQGTMSEPVIMTSVNGNAGDWGGLLLCGEGITTEGVDAIAEVGGLVYGGTNPADNSGNINYLVIEGAGAQINSESQYNGLSLYAVGSGTTISNVAILDGADDGVEFFGGSVSVENLYLENNEDDSVDWTEGWDGAITNTYVLHTITGFSTAIEADGENQNPTITNFTAVSETGGTALQFKKESGATITGLSLTGYDTSIDMRDNGPLANIQIDGADANPELTYTAPATVDVSMFDWVSNRGEVAEDILQGTITGDVVLDASVAYTLNSSLIVENGASLTIPAGTKITARAGGTDVYIAVLKGGTIDIQGTEENPVVMSSANEMAGDWGGLTICGNASTTAGVDAVAEVGGFIYGGNDDADSSGNISNLVVIGSGAQINAESQYNGISFYAVGSGTTVQNIAVINGADDGVEFFGGTVSAANIYLQDNEDDAVDWTEGWNGTITDTYVLHDITGFSTAVEADGVNANPKLINFTAVSSTGGTALQFKKESGATFTNASISGYATLVDMRDGGPVSNIFVDGTPLSTATDDVWNGTPVDISSWTWIDARL
ncbi:hypothetical protein [Robertkochia aurantiaca]|uniref:hypothetical protein n=1 Tax=Robertkochia aurantiaca TaxID=2873700 RepID=UPI001CCBB0DC|nr:hypothetical protein [Robertkochia sp. 3YJGBD-33]